MSISIGQEVGVTPVQLATMVSTIANGGVYMPPHILLASTDAMKGDPRLQPAAFHPANRLPDTLPPGAHRVIKEMTAAKMREMMRGIVVEGTGKAAALNGYSSGGKTGTANKIDVATHTYSHTKLVASFAGMAPVSNPAITVAVVIDTPMVGSKYGAAVSAPVFAEVAQEVLEYLGVPHDQPLKSKSEMLLAQANPEDSIDGAADDNGANLSAMFADVNDLPADDPLRQAASGSSAVPAAAVATPGAAPGLPRVPESLSAKALAAFHAQGNTTLLPTEVSGNVALAGVPVRPVVQTRADGGVVVDDARRVAVPAFTGEGLRAERLGCGCNRSAAGSRGSRFRPRGRWFRREPRSWCASRDRAVCRRSRHTHKAGCPISACRFCGERWDASRSDQCISVGRTTLARGRTLRIYVGA
jgi:cell division protein FtsI (penicillin-binding protein 3)